MSWYFLKIILNILRTLAINYWNFEMYSYQIKCFSNENQFKETVLYIMTQPVKFQSLEVDKTYTVLAYEEITTKFHDSHILRISDNAETFEMWATPSLSEHIVKNKLKSKFSFIVRRMKNGILKPEIEGKEKKERNIVELE